MSGSPTLDGPRRPSRRLTELLWPVIGLLAVIVAGWLLYREIHSLSWTDIRAAMAAIPLQRWIYAAASTVVAYAALAWYDRIALMHLGFRLSWLFISAVSFTTYALSHNIGMSMFSGGMVRYRAYSTRGLSVADVGVMVVFCSFTFALGTLFLGGVVCLVEPDIVQVLFTVPEDSMRLVGGVMVGMVTLYVAGSALHLPPLTLFGRKLEYPRPAITLRQVIAGPLELIGAAGIIYFALPEAANPGFVTVLGVFLASFSAAILSHAPGGLGVLELVFLSAMPEVPKADVLAALLVFRLFYLVLPLVFGIVAVAVFERSRLGRHATVPQA